MSIAILLGLWSAGCDQAPRATQAPTMTAAPPVTATETPQTDRPKNPLTGLEVADPALLKIPAVLISISHFPATARPQAGLSFAPFVYEFYITEGATRFLTTVYGEWPAPEFPVQGGCQPRIGPFVRSKLLLGNRAWLDANADGVQDPGEGGISGLCVNLYDESGKPLMQTSTDTNGFYGFDVPPGRYWVEFVRPDQLSFTTPNAGDPMRDSDADTALGRVQVSLTNDDLTIDAGLVPSPTAPPTPEGALPLPLAQVGPIRSGRLIYRYLARSFPESCLIYASASPEIMARLPKCAVVFHQILGGGYMLDLSELWSVAKANQRRSRQDFDYSGYEFSEAPFHDGAPATELKVFFAYQNQSGWIYDPASQSYLRYVDTSNMEEAGILHPETDRLTGRQLQVQNVIVLFAKHEVLSPTNLDIHLDPGRTGKAMLFRDGLELNIDWSTVGDEQGEGGRPIQFLQKNGQPVPLKPGHTWVIVVTPETAVEADGGGRWQLTFVQPEGAK